MGKEQAKNVADSEFAITTGEKCMFASLLMEVEMLSRDCGNRNCFSALNKDKSRTYYLVPAET